MSDPEDDRTLLAGGADPLRLVEQPIAVRLARSAVMGALFGDGDQGCLGRYRPGRRLGAGASGTVYVARDTELDRDVALKVLIPGDGTPLGHVASQRYLREARVVASLSHPNIVEIFDVGVHEGVPYLAMELVDGGSLAEWLVSAKPSDHAIVDAFIQAGEGLAAAHDREVVHRDFKPANVLIGRDGRVRVADFGLAAFCAGSTLDDAVSEHRESTGDASLTRTGAVLGTPAFMPPEQHRGESVDARADQYAFCASLFASLYGERPFTGDSLPSLYMAKEQRVIAGVAVPRRRAHVHAAILRGLSPHPQDRWPTMQGLLDALRTSRRRGRIAMLVGGGLIATGALGWGLARQADTCRDAATEIRADWNVPRAAALQAHLETIESDYADAAAIPKLHAFVRAWSSARAAACGDLDDDPLAFDHEVRCLDEARARFGASVTLLTALQGPRAASDAGELLSGLGNPSRCRTDGTTTQGRPRPADVALAASVDAVRAQRAAMAPRLDLGQLGPEDPEFLALMAAAEKTDYGPLIAEMTAVLGRLLELRGDLAAAAVQQDKAYALAAEHDDPEVMFAAALKLFAFHGREQQSVADAERWGQYARAAMARAGEPIGFRARYQDVQGTVALAQGNLDLALEHLSRAVQLFARQSPIDRRMLGAAQVNLGLVLGQLGREPEAAGTLQQAFEALSAELGPDHRLAIAARYNWGDSLSRLNRREQAVLALEGALASIERTQSADHPWVAVITNQLGSLARADEDLPRAKQLLHRALVASQSAVGARRDQLMFGIGGSYAEVLSALEEHEAAVTQMRETLALGRTMLDEDHPEVLLAQWRLATALQGAGDVAHAREEFERTIHEADEAGALDVAALARFSLANVLPASERERARTLATQARAQWAVDAPNSVTRPLAGTAAARIAEIETWLAELPGD